MKDKIFFSIVLVIAFIAGVIFIAGKPASSPQTNEVGCTMEAKMCPDGSFVGRSGPLCEFAKCPEPVSTNGWKTFTDATAGVTFKYPETIPTTYIKLVDWPPKVQIVNQAYTCTPGGSEIDRAGMTGEQIINGHTYCVTAESEGAAGSTYTLFAVGTDIGGGKTAFFTFSLRAPQCGNYNDPEKTTCEVERESFSINGTIDQIIQSLKLSKQ